MKAMKAMKAMVAMVAAAATVGGAGLARAIDLRNEDEASHAVVVTSPSMSRELAVRGLSLSLIVCVGECSFELPGVGVVRARGDDIVTIKDGTIVRTARAAAASEAK